MNQAEGLTRRAQCFVFLWAAAAIAIRAPDMFLNPQFYAEDATWYKDVYELGLAHTLFLPVGGCYLGVFVRLVAELSVLVPFRFAPLVMNLCGLAVQALPVSILLSRPCAPWGPLLVRVLMAAAYLALPNAGEVHVVLANSLWHLALIACLIVLANPPPNWPWKIFDVVILFLCGLTGPFCLFLLPVALIYWWQRRDAWRGIVCGVLAITAASEAFELLHGGLQTRVLTPLGASASLFAKLLAGQVYLGALIGQNEFANRGSLAVAIIICLIGTALIAWCFVKAGWELRLFILFAAMLLAAALKTPITAARQLQWEFLATSTGSRYWFFPMLAVAWSIIWWATQSQSKLCRVAGVACLAVMLFGAARDWRYAPFPDQHFPRYARKFEAAPSGTTVIIPICPEGREIRITKR